MSIQKDQNISTGVACSKNAGCGNSFPLFMRHDDNPWKSMLRFVDRVVAGSVVSHDQFEVETWTAVENRIHCLPKALALIMGTNNHTGSHPSSSTMLD
jgi:hypothetical protein